MFGSFKNFILSFDDKLISLQKENQELRDKIKSIDSELLYKKAQLNIIENKCNDCEATFDFDLFRVVSIERNLNSNTNVPHTEVNFIHNNEIKAWFFNFNEKRHVDLISKWKEWKAEYENRNRDKTVCQ